MFKSICTLAVIGGLCLAAAPAASAHERGYDHYQPRQLYVRVHRDRHMPHWLRQDREFRHWYRRASRHYDHRLAWWQLYEIYRWERAYRHDHDRRHYDGRGHAKKKRRHRRDD